MGPPPGTPRTYQVRTYGCQMNMHDSERLAGMLDAAGYRPADGAETPDVVVFNTCAVRENADNRLYGNLGQLRPVKIEHPGMQIAVGGCLAQKDQQLIQQRAPWVDVVFGTHNLHVLPALLQRSRAEARALIEMDTELAQFPSELPARRRSPYTSWVSISVGCNNTCTFCIVPSLRGRERNREPGAIRAEVQAVVAAGAVEVTLLGQNVNSYGSEAGERGAFSRLLRDTGGVAGLERLRFTSPHPRDFTPDVLVAMAETPAVTPNLHLPLQSGSDAVLRRMRRSYRTHRYLEILAEARATIPGLAVSTDIIVGFPGETEKDFADTLGVVAEARFASAFTFQYSPRPGTPAAVMADPVPPAVVAERYSRLVELQEKLSWEANLTLVGSDVEVLVASGEGRKDADTGRVSGRARDNRLVHLDAAAGAQPGDLVFAVVTDAAPHHLVARATRVQPYPRPGHPLAAPGAGGAGSVPDGRPGTVALGLPAFPPRR